jgi:hypothetical protein
MNSLLVPSSYGEALDRLTILEIKLESIQDTRRIDVQREYASLYSLVKDAIDKDKFHYEKLLEANRTMWKIQDELHSKAGEPNREFVLMKQLAHENQRRFRLKRTINENVGSLYKEQKGYKGKRAFVCGHQGMGDQFFISGAVRYLATVFDEVCVVVKKQYETNLRDLYSNESSVTFFLIEADSDVSPRFGAARDAYERATEGYDTVYMLGYHGSGNVEDFPHCFYRDLGMDPAYMKTWFNVPKKNVAEVEQLIDTYSRIRFVHPKASDAVAPIRVNLLDSLVINPSENMYAESHPWHAVAQAWVGRPILDYAYLMMYIQECLLVDSSFFCMALLLGLTPEVWVRNGRSYKNINANLRERLF